MLTRTFLPLLALTCSSFVSRSYSQEKAAEQLEVTRGFEMSVPAVPSYRGGGMVLLNRETTLLAMVSPVNCERFR